MPLPELARIRYVELFHEYLDKMPISEPNDYSLLLKELRALLTAHPQNIIDSKFSGYISSIKELIQFPDLYVENPIDYPEYQKLLKDCISAKIQALEAHSEQQKIDLINQYFDKQSQVALSRDIISTYAPPLPTQEAHTLNEEDWLQQQQQQFNQQAGQFGMFPPVTQHRAAILNSIITPNRLQQLPASMASIIRIHARRIRNLMRLDDNINMEDFLQLSEHELSEICISSRTITHLVQNGITLSELIHLTQAHRSAFLRYNHSTLQLIHEGEVPFESLIILENNILIQLLQNASHMVYILNHSSIEFEQFIQLDYLTRQQLLEHANAFCRLMHSNNSHISFINIINLEAETRLYILQHPREIERLIKKAHISFTKIMRFNEELRKQLLQNAFAVEVIICNAQVPLNLFILLPTEVRAKLLIHNEDLMRILNNTTIHFSDVILMPVNMMTQILSHSESLIDLLNNTSITFDLLKNQPLDIQLALLSHSQTVKKLLNPPFELQFSQLTSLDYRKLTTLLTDSSNPNSQHLLACLTAQGQAGLSRAEFKTAIQRPHR